jgi:hypothetical protein
VQVIVGVAQSCVSILRLKCQDLRLQKFSNLRTLLAFTFLVLLVLVGCGPSKKEETKTEPVKLNPAPVANADSAFFFVEKQVKFGPRIPNSNAHKRTGDYLVATLKRYGAKVTEQNFESMSYDGKKLFLRNIIASFNPEKQKRILLAAHWDTRPFADKDKEKPDAPFDGANDGASGVGVLLEVARLLKSGAAPNAGVDIIFFDGEDWGEKWNESGPGGFWALSIGHRTNTPQTTPLTMVFCSIWWAPRIQSFLEKVCRWNMHLLLWIKFGAPLHNLATPAFL